ncbi:MAG: two-component sensor histidine kinase, partial [Myxococcales bacterium]|nr:two-component sensor histidine kinase [Myxococcales bacterium]
RCDVRSVVRSCVELVKPQKRFKELTLTIDLADELPMARITAGKLQQVLVNLLFNAADALGEAEISAPTVRIHGETLDSRLSLYVSDNGPGIAPEHLRRIFDPFFTTKEPGSGTGLGLSISQQILKHVGGDLRVEASVGGGATFVIDLPLIAAGGGVAL